MHFKTIGYYYSGTAFAIAYIIVAFTFLFRLSSPVFAAEIPNCGGGNFAWISASGGDIGQDITSGTKDSIFFNVTKNQMPEGIYRIMAYSQWNNGGASTPLPFTIPTGGSGGVSTEEITLFPNNNPWLTKIQVEAGGETRVRNIYLEKQCYFDPIGCESSGDGIAWDRVCKLGSYTLVRDDIYECSPNLRLKQERPASSTDGQPTTCYSGGCLDTRTPIFLDTTTIQNKVDNTLKYASRSVIVNSNRYSGTLPAVTNFSTDASGKTPLTDVSFLLPIGSTTLELTGGQSFRGCTVTANIVGSCQDRCQQTPVGEVVDINFDLCAQASGDAQAACIKCFGTGNHIWTAVGCIETKPQSIIQAVVKIGVGIGGGIALLMTLVGGFLLTTSQGDPKRTQEGKEMITSSVIGILFVLFSVVILQFIGVTIFRIPGFGT